MSDQIKDLEKQLALLKTELAKMSQPSMGRPKKTKTVDGVNHIPMGRSGKAMKPIVADEAREMKIKGFKAYINDCKMQSERSLMKREGFKQDLNKILGEPITDPELNINYEKIQDVANWLREHDKANEAEYLEDFLENFFPKS